MKKAIPAICMIWLVLIAGSFFWNYSNSRKERERIAFVTAREFFDQIVISRVWNAFHGGVYVPVTKTTRPNPYLDIPMRDIKINKDLTLAKVNPALMTRQISEITSGSKGIRFHITSLTPIRPANKPNEKEKAVLESFEKGEPEFGEFVGNSEQSSFFYMAPLKTRKSCLTCHAKQGDKEGDIRGGISITLPIVYNIPLMPLLLGHLGIGLAGIIGILVFGFRLDKAYATIRTQARFDDLTGIGNRRNFSETIPKEYRRSRREKKPLSVLMCDIDYFKNYNDTFGHKMGDICLKKIAREIQNSLTRPADACFRYGGEEFVVILPNTPDTGAIHVAEKIRTNILKLQIPHDWSPILKTATISLGVAGIDGETDVSFEELIHRADLALHQAKQKGRNRVETFAGE